MKQELNTMIAFGRSKHNDQVRTFQVRSLQKSAGVPFAERQKVNFTTQYIYSQQTLKTYLQQADAYAKWLVDNGFNKRMNLDEAKSHIQDYLNFLNEERHLSPATIHTASASLCKIFHTQMCNYEKLQRSISKITRGTGERTRDNYNEHIAGELLQANRLLGIRRNELRKLKAKDIYEKDGKVIVETIGKGGKNNKQYFYLENEKKELLQLKVGKEAEEKIFDRNLFKTTADLHHMRELRAKDVYNYVLRDIAENGETARQKYVDEIYRIFKENHKTLHENLDKNYYLRGANRETHIKDGKPIEYDRCILLFISCTVLSHFRSNVTCNYYVGK